MCVSDCIQKINVSGQDFCSWCHETIRYGPVNQHFVWLFFCFKFTSYYCDICKFCRGNEDSRGNENRKSWKRIFSVGKKSISILFFPVKIKMIGLWMLIEVWKLIFVINFSVLDFFKFTSRMPQTAQILVSTFKIFSGEHAPGPPYIFPLILFFFSNSQDLGTKFLFFSTLTQSDFPLVVADRLKSMLYLYQNIFCCCTRIYIYIYIFFFFFFFFFYRSIPTDCSCQMIRDFC